MPLDWRPLHMTAVQFITSADIVTQTLLETGWVCPKQMQRLCVVAQLQQQNLVGTIISHSMRTLDGRSNYKLDPTRRCAWLS